MPTYEYECQRCKRRHEAFQTITAKPLTKCPHCRGKLQRLLGGGAAFLFKGSGFYITDYRSKSYQEAKKKDQPASPPSAETAGGVTCGSSGSPCAGGTCATDGKTS